MTSLTPRVRFDASLWQLPKQAMSAGAGTSVDFGNAHWQTAHMQQQSDGRIHRLSGTTMGTTWSLRLVNPDYQPMEPVQVLVQLLH